MVDPSAAAESRAPPPGTEAGADADLLRLIFTDDLTGLYNRRFFFKHLKQDASWSETSPPLALCMMDLDYLKRINDRLGHLAGDRVLARIGKLLKDHSAGGYPIRYAGDEFALILPGKSRDEALKIAEQCRASIASDEFEDAGLPEGLHPSLSVGVAAFPEDAKVHDDLIDRADKALYYSKRTGKNKVTSAAAIEGREEVADLDSFEGFPSRTVIGRDEQIRAVGDAIDLARDGRNAFVLIEGAPGIGKTRFLYEVVRYAKERDVITLLDRANQVAREEPYKLLAGLLDRYFRSEPSALAVVAKALDEPKRRALGDIVPAVHERETAQIAIEAAGKAAAAMVEAAKPLEPPKPAETKPAEAPKPAETKTEAKPPAPASLAQTSTKIPLPKPAEKPAEKPADKEPLLKSEPPTSSGRRPAQAGDKPATAGAPSPSTPQPPVRRPAPPAAGPPKPGARPPAARPGVPRPGSGPAAPAKKPGAPAAGPPRPAQPGASSGTRPATGRPAGPAGAKPATGPAKPATPAKPEAAAADGEKHDKPFERPPTGQHPIPKDGAAKTEAPKPDSPAKPTLDRAATREVPLVRKTPDGRPIPREAKPARPVMPATGAPAVLLDEAHGPVATGPIAPGAFAEVGFSDTADPVTPAPPAGAETGQDSATYTVMLFLAVVEALTALSTIKPLLILIDEVEHADEATLEVISRCLPRDGRMLFCGATRTVDSTIEKPEKKDSEDDEEEAPFVAFRESLSEHPNVFRIELMPLDRIQTGALVENLLQGFRPPPVFLDRIHEIAKGNPLFTEGIVRHLITSDLMVRHADGWKINGEFPADVPITLDELVRAQLAVLDPETADLVADAAVIGPNFDFALLKGMAKNKGEGEALDLVETARKARILRETGDTSGLGNEVEFASSALQSEAYRRLDAGRRQATHRRVADLVLESGDVAADAASLAFHYRRAGDREKAERFQEVLRERRDLIFDRDAIETLGEERPPRIPEVNDAPALGLAPNVPVIAKAFAQAVKTVRMYPPNAKPVTEAVEGLRGAIAKALELTPAFTLSHRGNSLLLNGATLDDAYGGGTVGESLATIYRTNSVKAITFTKSPPPEELVAVLAELGSRSVQTPLERGYWWRFGEEKDLKRVCVVQKTFVLKSRHGKLAKLRGARRIAETELPTIRELVRHFSASVDSVRMYPKGHNATTEAMQSFDKSLRTLFGHVPAVAVNEADGGLIVNGTMISAKVLGTGGNEVVRILKDLRLRGFVILADATAQEVQRFLERVGAITPKDAEGDGDPGRAISEDGSFPNIMVGEAMFKLAESLLGPASAMPLDESHAEEDSGEEPTPEGEAPEKPDDAPSTDAPPELPAEAEVEPQAGLPPGFVWPSDEVGNRARKLGSLAPKDMVQPAVRTELLDVCELLLLDGKDQICRILLERMAIVFASDDKGPRRRAAEVFLELTRRASAELRARFLRAAVRRLSDALELEVDVDVFTVLARAAKQATVERIADGDWATAARLVWAMGRRREASVATNAELKRIARDSLNEIIKDPRTERLFETIETGATQERRLAARVLEGMGNVAIGPIVEALKKTGRARVETFLIDMLLALAPESDGAIQKEVTPYAPGAAVKRLLRAASVVCRDPSPVLVAALENPDPQVRIDAIQVARSLGGKVATAVLRWAVKHGQPEVQLAAVSGLGALAQGEGAQEIAELLETSEYVEVQRECCLALGKLQTDRAVPVLSKAVRAGGILWRPYPEAVRTAAAWALGQMKANEEARKALERALEDKNEKVKLTARLVLEGRA